MSVSEPPILLLEPNFRHLAGHYFRYARVIQSESQRRGIGLCVATAKEIEPGARQSLERLGIEVLPLFPDIPYKRSRDRAIDWQSAQVTLKAALHAYDLANTQRLAWLSGLPAHVEPMALFAQEVAHGFVFQLIDFASEWPSGAKAAPASIRHHLKRAARAGVSIYAQTRFVADAAEAECDIPFKAFPPILDLKTLAHRHRDGKPRVGLMNVVMSYKDWDAAFSALEENAHLVEVLVHTGVHAAKHWEDIRKRAAVLGATFHHGALLPDAYERAWLSLDAVILPYAADYARKGSGMFYESLSDAVIPIVPVGTSMAALAQEIGVGLVYDPSDGNALATAIRELARDYQKLSALSAAAAPRWRRANNPSKVFDLIERAWPGSLATNQYQEC